MKPYSSSLADPDGADAILAAIQWLQGTTLGTVATTVAVIAIATIGFLMLAGRMDWRRATTVIAGCFVIFGASGIAAGVRLLTEGSAADIELGSATTRLDVTSAPQSAPPPSPFDPYGSAND
jgi:type IV secretion system protein VirB2